MLIKNKSGQKIPIFAWDALNDTPKTGDAANITARYRKDGGSVTQSNDTNPTEVDATYMPGVYEFDPLQAETNCDALWWYAKSATAYIRIEPLFMFPLPDVPGTYGAVNDAGADTDDFDTDLTEASDDHYNKLYMVFLSGVLTGQARKISDYVGSSKNITVSDPFTDAPTTGDRFVILGRSE
jgi:hypothetical protein